MTTKKKDSKDKTVHRRAVLQTIALSLGAVGLGRAIFACEDTSSPNPPRTTTGPGTAPTDGDEYVGDAGTPVNAGDEPPKVPNQVWESRVKQLEAEQARLFRPEVFTLASPGIMAGKERSHVPGASVVDENGVKRVVVTVQHVMGNNKLDAGAAVDSGYVDSGKDAADSGDAGDAGDGGPIDAGTIIDASKPPDAAVDAAGVPIHYITTIYLRAVVNGSDTVVGLWEFASTDPAPPSVKFTLPLGVTTVVAFEWCTLHGLWSSVPLTV